MERDTREIRKFREFRHDELRKEHHSLLERGTIKYSALHLALFKTVDKHYYLRFWKRKERLKKIDELKQQLKQEEEDFNKEQDRILNEIASLYKYF